MDTFINKNLNMIRALRLRSYLECHYNRTQTSRTNAEKILTKPT